MIPTLHPDIQAERQHRIARRQLLAALLRRRARRTRVELAALGFAAATLADAVLDLQGRALPVTLTDQDVTLARAS